MSQPCTESEEVSDENNSSTAETMIKKMLFTLQKKTKKEK